MAVDERMSGGRATVVVGSGPAGVACAAELVARGVPVTVLERGDGVADAWARRYDALRFNTSRLHSALPGAPFPRAFGQFPTRDQYVGYLRAYARRRGVRVEPRCEVTRLDEGRTARWRVRTGGGTLDADHVVVATGLWNRPAIPAWARTGELRGPVVHTADYRNPAPFAGRDVVVVGAGSTGLEVAWELTRGGARSVRLAVRTPPNILLRAMGGLPADLPVPLFLHLPTPVVDRMLRGMQRTFVGDLTAYGLPTPTEGAFAALMRRGAGTAIVDACHLEAIRDGSVRVVPAVTGLDADGVLLADGTRQPADAVVLATGFTPGLEGVVGHLGVLDARGLPRDGTGGELLPGLRFVGYVYRPGLTRYVGRIARRVAREIAAATPVGVAA